MYLRTDNRLLRTKIVATIGEPHDEIFDPKDRFIDEWKKEFKDPKGFYEALLSWFVQPNQPDFYMVDIIRLNMAFAKQQTPYGANECLIFNWLRNHKNDLAKNVAVLGDLPGPKLRLGDVGNPVLLNKNQSFQLHYGARKPAGAQGASILAYDDALGRVVRNYQQLRTDIRNRLTSSSLLVFIGDGEPILRIKSENNGVLECEVEKEGKIKDGRGVTFRGLLLDIDAFQQDDKDVVDFLLEHGYDWNEDFTDPQNLSSFLGFIGVSFVKEKEDIKKVKRYIEEQIAQKYCNTNAWKTTLQKMKEALEGQERHLKQEGLEQQIARLLSPAIIAKIETPQAWEKIDEILDVADGAMVARGDLGLQLEPQEVPAIQKQLIRLCNLRGKIVITATQMLNSMEESREPTRAEATDVFNAILDGSDAVMLSGETSKGRYPFHAVLMMAKIAEKAEQHFESFGRRRPLGKQERRRLNEQRYEELLVGAGELVTENTERLRAGYEAASLAGDDWQKNLYLGKWKKSLKQGTTDRISLSACRLAESDDCRAIIIPTASGRTARMIARFRPSVPIIGVAHDIVNRRKLLISFGVYPINAGMSYGRRGQVFQNVDEMFGQACTELRNHTYIANIIIGGRLQFEAVFTAGTPIFEPGTTNLVQIREVT